MAQLKFYKSASAPAAAATGAVWFDTTDHTIQVKTATGWDKYAGALNDATWSNNTLTITKHDGSSIALDFSDMASAAAMKAIFTDKIGLNADLGYTPVYTGNTNVKADVASAKLAIESVDNKVGVVTTASAVSGDTAFAKIATLDAQIKAITGEGEEGDATTIAGLAVKVSNNEQGIEAINKKIGGEFTEQNTVASEIKAAKTVVNEKATGHVTVSVTEGADKNAVVTIAENDIASAQDLSDVDDRVAAIEAVMGGDDADKAINKVSEIITFLNGIEEGTVAKDTFDAVTAHGTAITNLQNNTVNGKKISENPVLAGSDVLLTGYTEQAASALNATDSINVALGKLEARVDAAAAGGVQSVGGKAGSITLDTDATGEGKVKFAISEAGEISATVNIGATAEQGAKADRAIRSVNFLEGSGYVYIDLPDEAEDGVADAELHVATDIEQVSSSGSQLADAYAVKTYVDSQINSALEWALFE